MVLVLCLGLLPATALAAENAPSTLIVGNVTVDTSQDGYWITDSNGGLTDEGASSKNYNVHYNTSTNTLILKDATITGEYNVISNPNDAGIYASASENQSVSLTIVLRGGNNQVSGSIGIYVYSFSSGTASLAIQGGGSLDASGNVNGIRVQSNNGNATLSIENAAVTATHSGIAGNGVLL